MYGTDYCNAQCPRDIKFINGEANCEGWGPSPSDKNSGEGKYGTCCNEMYIWEANRISTAYTPHVYIVERQTRCEGSDCGPHTGFCDKAGCDFNPYCLGDKTFFGPSNNFTVDSTKPFTVVTQFITADGTDNGDLSEIIRLWVQKLQSSNVAVGGQKYNSVTDGFCSSLRSKNLEILMTMKEGRT